MSKASIHAACVTLMKEAGVTRHDISTIFFAGAFGNYLDKKNATIIGLIPEIELNRIKNIGNGAVTGANLALINRRERKTLDEIASRIAYIELNAEPSFMDEYTLKHVHTPYRSHLVPDSAETPGNLPAQERVIAWQK